MQMTKNTKIYSTSLDTSRSDQTKTRYCLHPSGRYEQSRKNKTRVDEDEENVEFLNIACGKVDWFNQCEIHYHSFSNIKYRITVWSNNSIPGNTYKKNECKDLSRGFEQHICCLPQLETQYSVESMDWDSRNTGWQNREAKWVFFVYGRICISLTKDFRRHASTLKT